MRFEELGDLGEGTYGVVKKCRHRASGLIVAIKKFKDCKDNKQKQMINKTAAREVQVLEAIQHVNLVRLLDSFRVGRRLHLVFEYVDGTVLQALEAKPQGLGDFETRKIMWQLVRAAEHLHSHDIVHRDIKPENMLLSRDGMLKLCDFGFARYMSMHHLPRDMSGYVATRWYRAPELLLADNDYGPKVDVWAIGCMLVEIQTGEPLFAGESDVDQLWIIMKSFTDAQTASLRGKLLLQRMQMPAANERQPLHHKFHHLGPDALSFLEACLHPHPDFRLSCKQLLEMPYFRGAESWFRPTFFTGEGAKAARLAAVSSDKESPGLGEVSKAQNRPRRQKRRNESHFHVPAALNISPLREPRPQLHAAALDNMQSTATLNPAQRCAELRQGFADCAPDGEHQASVMMSKCNISSGPQDGRTRGGQIELSVRAGPLPSNGYPDGANFAFHPTPPQEKYRLGNEPGNQGPRFQTPNGRPQKRPPGKQGREGGEFQSPDPRWRRRGRQGDEFQSPDPRWRRQGHHLPTEDAHRTPSRLGGHAEQKPHPKHTPQKHSMEMQTMRSGQQPEHNSSPIKQPDRNKIPAFYGKQGPVQHAFASPNRWAAREASHAGEPMFQVGWDQRYAQLPQHSHFNGHAHNQGSGVSGPPDLSQQGHRMTNTGHLPNQKSPFRWDSPSRMGHGLNCLKQLAPSESPLRAQAAVFVPLAMQMQGKRAELH